MRFIKLGKTNLSHDGRPAWGILQDSFPKPLGNLRGSSKNGNGSYTYEYTYTSLYTYTYTYTYTHTHTHTHKTRYVMGQPAGQPFVFLKFDFRRRRPNPTRSQMETPELIVNRCVFLQIL